MGRSKLSLGLAAALVAMLLGTPAHALDQEQQAMARAMAAQMNRELPRTLYDGTILLSTEWTGDSIAYNYKIPFPVQFIQVGTFREALIARAASQLCAGKVTREAMESGIGYLYSYQDSSDTPFLKVSITFAMCKPMPNASSADVNAESPEISLAEVEAFRRDPTTAWEDIYCMEKHHKDLPGWMEANKQRSEEVSGLMFPPLIECIKEQIRMRRANLPKSAEQSAKEAEMKQQTHEATEEAMTAEAAEVHAWMRTNIGSILTSRATAEDCFVRADRLLQTSGLFGFLNDHPALKPIVKMRTFCHEAQARLSAEAFDSH